MVYPQYVYQALKSFFVYLFVFDLVMYIYTDIATHEAYRNENVILWSKGTHLVPSLRIEIFSFTVY